MSAFAWNSSKNEVLKAECRVSFEEVIEHLAAGDLLDIVEHPHQEKYRGQRILIVRMHDDAWVVPFVEADAEIVLKTFIPSRKATRKYLRGG